MIAVLEFWEGRESDVTTGLPNMRYGPGEFAGLLKHSDAAIECRFDAEIEAVI